MKRVEDVEKRLDRLEFRDGLYRHLLDHPNDSLMRFALDNDLSLEQLNGIALLMHGIHKELIANEATEFYKGRKVDPPTPKDLTSRLRSLAADKVMADPDPDGFAKAVLLGFGGNRQYVAVYEHMRKQGLNIPDLKYLCEYRSLQLANVTT